jgi:hypothetical protein
VAGEASLVNVVLFLCAYPALFSYILPPLTAIGVGDQLKEERKRAYSGKRSSVVRGSSNSSTA